LSFYEEGRFMKVKLAAFALALGLGACADDPVSPPAAPPESALLQQGTFTGTGLVLNSLTGLTLPLIPIDLGTVTVNQAVITNFALIENTVGQIIGLEVSGVLQLTGGVLGTNVLTEDFTTTAKVTSSSGSGRCSLVSIDLGPINLGVLGGFVASIDLPAATVNAGVSGAVGSILCSLANLPGILPTGGRVGRRG
jgi:hypothetical protein